MLQIDDLSFMAFQLINTLSHLNIPDSGSPIKRRWAKISAVWIELDWRYLSCVSCQILHHFSVQSPKTHCMVEGTSCNHSLLWKMREIEAENCISMTRESADQVSSVRVPNFAGSIIAGCGKIISILAKPAVSKWLFMRFQLEGLLVLSILVDVSIFDFYHRPIIYSTQPAAIVWHDWPTPKDVEVSAYSSQNHRYRCWITPSLLL